MRTEALYGRAQEPTRCRVGTGQIGRRGGAAGLMKASNPRVSAIRNCELTSASKQKRGSSSPNSTALDGSDGRLSLVHELMLARASFSGRSWGKPASEVDCEHRGSGAEV